VSWIERSSRFSADDGQFPLVRASTGRSSMASASCGLHGSKTNPVAAGFAAHLEAASGSTQLRLSDFFQGDWLAMGNPPV
jgi:hypothetical protein